MHLSTALHKKSYAEKISPAKAQSAAAFLSGFLCAFAPLREKNFFSRRVLDRFEHFLCKAFKHTDRASQNTSTDCADYLCNRWINFEHKKRIDRSCSLLYDQGQITDTGERTNDAGFENARAKSNVK
jgi:hypothetical protein